MKSSKKKSQVKQEATKKVARTSDTRTGKNGAPPELIENASRRKNAFIKAVRKAMAEMELEIDKNEGIYPFNGGELSAREVCRRAAVSHQTLQGVLHRDKTRVEVNSWVERIRAKAVQGYKKVRKAVTERADSWKERHDNIAHHYHKNKLEMIDLRAKIVKLEADNEALREQMRLHGSGTIIPLPKRNGKDGNSSKLNRES